MKSLCLLPPLLLAMSTIAHPMHPKGLNPRGNTVYTNIFYDNFEEKPGSLPSSSNWIIDLGTSYPGGPPNWGTGEVQTYTQNSNNLHINNQNNLVIAPQVKYNSWTSARIETARSDFAAPEGEILWVESKIKLGSAGYSKQQGIWPAFWAMGAEFRGNYMDWPAASEWDFMESPNGENITLQTLHCGTAPGGPCNEDTGIRWSVGIDRTSWNIHTFVVDRSMVGPGKSGTWKEETLYWLLNGEVTFTVNGAMINDKATWESIAHQGHFLLLNVAVGGALPGNPTRNTLSGEQVQMEVEYVGVWLSY